VRDVSLALLGFSTVMATLFAGVMALGIWHDRSLRAALDNPASGWCGALVLFFGVLALVNAAALLGHQEEPWRGVALVAINLLVQPVCGLLVAAGGHMFVNGVFGRLTYQFRVVPREAFDPLTYRQSTRARTIVGLLGVAFFGGLGAVCLWPLL
jgi:hypothetical protein